MSDFAKRETKSIIRLYVEPALAEGQVVEVSKDQAHYLVNVMRAKLETQLLLFNGRDGEWLASITDISKRSASLTCSTQTRAQTSEPDVWLCFAPLKRARTDYMVEKASELGVGKIWPVMTQRTNADRIKQDRLQAHALEAAEQCERLSVPEVADASKLDAMLTRIEGEGRELLFCDEDLSGQSAVSKLANLKAQEKAGKWAILIGPEGGFTDTERARIRAYSRCHTVSLGPRLLRADTAAIAALTIWQATTGDW